MSLLDPLLDLFRGKAVTIPPMDGALKPNTALDDAEVVAAALAPDNLAVLNGTPHLFQPPRTSPARRRSTTSLETCPAEVTALAVARGRHAGRWPG